jgi:hypothetical protein
VDLLWLDHLSRPGIFPVGLGGGLIDLVVGRVLLLGLEAVLGLEAGEKPRHF